MTPRHIKLPHNFRIFSATLLPRVVEISLWLLLFGILIINSTLRSDQNYNKKLERSVALLKNQRAEDHIKLARLQWKNGFTALATEEIDIANTLAKRMRAETNTLGLATPVESIHLWEKQRQSKKEDYVYWQGITSSKTDYTLGFLFAAKLAYELGEPQEAHLYLSRALLLEPNNQTLKVLQSVIQGKVIPQ